MEVFNQWTQQMIETKPKKITSVEDTVEDTSVEHLLNILERVQKSVTPEAIQEYIDNEECYQHGELILDTLYDMTYDLDTDTVVLNSKSETFNITIILNSNGTIEKGHCDCSIGGKCKHCVATLLYFVKYPDRFPLGLPAYLSSSFQSDTSSSKKRSLQSSLDDEEDTNDSKRSRSSQNDSVSKNM